MDFSASKRSTNPKNPGMSLGYCGKMRDNIHNTIQITSCEKKIIDCLEFQRLRRIHQTAFISFVFPCANHSRFEHSLGAMHLSHLFYTSLLENQKKILCSLKENLAVQPPQVLHLFLDREAQSGSLLQTEDTLETMSSSTYLRQCVRFAALLHDVGHAPFSHSGEKFMPTWGALAQHLLGEELPSWLRDCLLCKINQKNEEEKQTPIHHEVYSLLLIEKMFREQDPFLSPKMAQDICSLLDISIPPSPAGELEQSGLQSLFHDFISGELDVDRMDYLVRDSVACGVVYGHFDVGRIIDSIGFYQDLSTQKMHLALHKSGIFAYEDFLRARWSMYQQVYFHKTATACEAMLEDLKKTLQGFYLPLNLNEYIKLDDTNLRHHILDKYPFLEPQTKEHMENLIQKRVLWKRIYEESHVEKGDSHICEKIVSYLEEKGIPAEIVETETTLTKLAPDKNKNNAPTLKLILKDIHSLKYVDSVEDHSFLAQTKERKMHIKRIFVSTTKKNGDLVHVDKIQEEIYERILQVP